MGWVEHFWTLQTVVVLRIMCFIVHMFFFFRKSKGKLKFYRTSAKLFDLTWHRAAIWGGTGLVPYFDCWKWRVLWLPSDSGLKVYKFSIPKKWMIIPHLTFIGGLQPSVLFRGWCNETCPCISNNPSIIYLGGFSDMLAHIRDRFSGSNLGRYRINWLPLSGTHTHTILLCFWAPFSP